MMKIIKNDNSFIFNEDVYRTVFENTGSATVIINSDTKLIFVNKKFEELSGYTKKEIENKMCWTDFVLKEDLERMLEEHNLRRKENNDALKNYLFRFVDKSKNIKHISLAIDLIPGTDKSVASLIDITEKKHLEEKMEKLNNVLLSFSNNYNDNINKLTALAGEFFGATCSIYNCLKNGNLHSLATWNTPKNYKSIDKAEGHICYDVIFSNEDVFTVRNLQNSSYLESDPNVREYKLETYIGHVVKCENNSIGSLCVVFQKDFVPNSDSLKLLGIMASAIGREEERKKYLEKLEESEIKFKTMYENVPGGTMIIDENYKIKDVNSRTCEITGYSKEELIGQYCDLICPKGRESRICPILAQGKESFEGMDGGVKCKKGEVIPILKNAKRITLNGKLHILEHFEDISKIKKVESDLEREKNNLNNILDNSVDAIIISDRNGKIIRCNNSANKLFGYNCDELKKTLIYDLYLSKIELKLMSSIIKKKGFVKDYEIELKKRNGEYFYGSISVNTLFENNIKIGSVSLIRDLSDRKKIEGELKLLSYQDLLTGAYNRNFFIKTIKELRNYNSNLGLIICDLDGLKFINDTFGHNIGDEVIINTGKILLSSIKPHDILTRIGGDEFAIFIKNDDLEILNKIVNRIKLNLKEYNKKNPELPLSMSIGYSFGNPYGEGIDKLYKDADHNMLNKKKININSNKNQIMKALMKTLEARDHITEGHVNRLEKLVVGFGNKLGLSEDIIDRLQLLAKFHDIGKVGIPDSILFKQGLLTKEEFEEMKKHSEIGFRIANGIPDLVEIADLIKKHHEKWDGSGYPIGIKANEIPLESRIIAILDAFDVMISERPYKKPMKIEEAINEIIRCSGTQFDPILAKEFIDYLKIRFEKK